MNAYRFLPDRVAVRLFSRFVFAVACEGSCSGAGNASSPSNRKALLDVAAENCLIRRSDPFDTYFHPDSLRAAQEPPL